MILRWSVPMGKRFLDAGQIENYFATSHSPVRQFTIRRGGH